MWGGWGLVGWILMHYWVQAQALFGFSWDLAWLGLWQLILSNKESSCQISAQSDEKWLSYRLIRYSAALHGILQCHCFVSRYDHFHLVSTTHGKFQLNPKRNDSVSGWLKIRDSAALHGILQRCRQGPSFASRSETFHHESNHAHSSIRWEMAEI